MVSARFSVKSKINSGELTDKYHNMYLGLFKFLMYVA